MNELERRLTNALHAEADTVQPQTSSWNGRPVVPNRRGWPMWLAAAAVVTAVMIGATLAVTTHGAAPDAARPPAQATGSTSSPTTGTAAGHPCDGGWTAPGTTVITGTTEPAAPGATAILRFAGDPPGTAILCALVTTPDGTVLASGSADLDGGSKLGFLTVITGRQTYLVGAFDGTATTLTFASGDAPTSRGASGTVAVTASTAGVINLGNGWHGYAVQAARSTSSTVQVTATSTDGTVLGRHDFTMPAASSTSLASPSIASTKPPAATPESAPVSTTQSPSGDLSSAVQCGSRLPSPLSGIAAAVVPQPNGEWQFRLTNATKVPFTVDTLHGYAQVLTDEHGVVTSVSQDSSYVLRKPTILKAGGSTVFPVVGLDTALCGGGTVPAGKYQLHLVISGELNNHPVVFTAASFVVNYRQVGAPTLAK